METITKGITKNRIITFLSIVFGILYIPWIIGIIIPSLREAVYAIISFPVVFMGTPALAVFITRKLTKDTTPLNFSTKIFKDKKALLFSTLIPGAAIFLGTVLFFLIFPEDLDFQRRVYNFNKYIKKMKLDSEFFGLDNIAFEFYSL